MKKFDLLKPTKVDGRTTDYQHGFIELTEYMEEQITTGVPYMLAPRINPYSGRLQYVSLEPAKVEPEVSKEEFDASMAEWAKEIEEDAWIVFQYRIGSISFEEAHTRRGELREKRWAKIREEERAKAKAKLIELLESL